MTILQIIKTFLTFLTLLLCFSCNSVGTFKEDTPKPAENLFNGVTEVRTNFDNTYSLFWTGHTPADGTAAADVTYLIFVDIDNAGTDLEMGSSTISEVTENRPADIGKKLASVRGSTSYQIDMILEKGNIYRFQVNARTSKGTLISTKNVAYFAPSIATDGSNGKAVDIFLGLESATATSTTKATLTWTNLPTDLVAVYKVFQVGKTSELIVTTESPIELQNLIPGNTYSFFVRAYDCIDVFCSHDGNTVIRTLKMPTGEATDLVPPGKVSSIVDGDWHDSQFQSPLISWHEASDDEGVSHYEMSLGSSLGGLDIKGWTDVGSSPAASMSGLFLTNGLTYYPSIRAIDLAGNVGEAVNGDGWSVDSKAPNDITTASVDTTHHNNMTTTPELTWGPVIDPTPADGVASGLSHYEMAVGSYKNSTDIHPWTSVGNVTSSNLADVPLLFGNEYHVSVRAVDFAGNSSTVFPTTGDSDVKFATYPDHNRTSTQSFLEPVFNQSIKRSGTTYAHKFGTKVTSYGDYAAVSIGQFTYRTTDSASQLEFISVFKFIDGFWTQHQTLMRGPGSDKRMGHHGMTMSDEWLAVDFKYGDHTSLSNPGEIWMYKRDSESGLYEMKQTVIATPYLQTYGQFGMEIQIRDDLMAVGYTHYDDDGNTTQDLVLDGVVLTYRLTGDTWVFESIIRPSNPNSDANPATYDYFGFRIALGDNLMAVSNELTDSSTVEERVYIFTFDGTNWNEQDILTRGAGLEDKFYGENIVFDGTDLLVSCRRCNQGAISEGGTVYHYTTTDSSSWTLKTELSIGSAATDSHYGICMSKWGNKLVVGGHNGSGVGTEDGDVVVFEKSGSNWVYRAQHIPSFGAAGTQARYCYSKHFLSAGEHGFILTSATIFGESIMNPGAKVASGTGGLGVFFSFRQYIETADVAPVTTDLTSTPLISWTLHADANSAEIDNYEVSIGTTLGGRDTLQWTDAGTDLSTTMSELNLGYERYFVAVRAKLKSGGYSDPLSAGSFYAQIDYANTTPTETIITPLDGTDGDGAADNHDRFGNIAFDGTYLFVGGNSADSPTKVADGMVVVYKYENGTYTQTQILEDFATGAGNDNFGSDVVVANGVLAIGESGSDTDGTNSGRVHIYRLNNGVWEPDQILSASDASMNDYFGIRLAISADGSRLAVSAHAHDNDQGVETDYWGAVYVYEFDGTSFTDEDIIIPSDSEIGAKFGLSLDISPDGNVIVVGAPYNDKNGVDNGLVYLFHRLEKSNWVQLNLLQSGDADTSVQFGASVALDDGILAVGEPNSDVDGTNDGRVKIYRLKQGFWTHYESISPPSTAGMFYFGTKVELNNGVLAVSTKYSTLHSNSEGSVHLYSQNSATKEFEFVKTIDKSISESGSGFGSSSEGSNHKILIEDDQLFITSTQFEIGARENGKIFIYDFEP